MKKIAEALRFISKEVSLSLEIEHCPQLAKG